MKISLLLTLHFMVCQGFKDEKKLFLLADFRRLWRSIMGQISTDRAEIFTVGLYKCQLFIKLKSVWFIVSWPINDPPKIRKKRGIFENYFFDQRFKLMGASLYWHISRRLISKNFLTAGLDHSHRPGNIEEKLETLMRSQTRKQTQIDLKLIQ